MKETVIFLLLMSSNICCCALFYIIGLQKGVSWEQYETLHKKYIKALDDHISFIRDLRK